ncbi:MAG: site-2 protease family protein, partial [Planctomycetota bacterium]|jgi:regulator of sigma E protease|nr:site-2 protease family protein [Planctomycetota bacterium]
VRHAYGFGLERANGIYRTESVSESIRAGAQASWRFLTDAWMTLQKMFLREVSTENLGGIIAISTVSYDWASQGWAKLFFFLCMLSINLAFLNVLPIPVLDGGHLAFCVVEAIKGSPVSERTLGYSQVIGLVLILTLTIYVTYQDVLRLLPSGP